jgi:hypothetical protein
MKKIFLMNSLILLKSSRVQPDKASHSFKNEFAFGRADDWFPEKGD